MEARKLDTDYRATGEAIELTAAYNDETLEFLGCNGNRGVIRLNGELYEISKNGYTVTENEYIRRTV